MFLYKAKVRVSGSLNNEVLKDALTAPEIAILQRIHGKDAVVDVVEVGQVMKRTDRSERNRLAGIYAYGPSADGKSRLSGETFIDSVLGVGNTLAKEYSAPVSEDPADIEPEEQEEIVLNDAVPIVRAKIEPVKPVKDTKFKPKAVAPTDELLEA